MYSRFAGFLVLAVFPGFLSPAVAEEQAVLKAPDVVHLDHESSLTAVLYLDEPWYVYAPTGINAAQGLIELEVELEPVDGFTFASPVYPTPVSYDTFEVLFGPTIEIKQPLRVERYAPAGAYTIHAGLTFQSCDGSICLPPQTVPLSVMIELKDAKD